MVAWNSDATALAGFRSFLNVSSPVKGIAGPTERLGALQTLTCTCGETQTMSYIVESCPLTKLNGGLSQLHSADDAAIAWLTIHKKKKLQ